MPNWIRTYVHVVEAVNYRVGRFAMYLIFALMAVLLWSSISKTFFLPSLWTLEMAQFIMVAYYLLGGPYSMQLNSHVRMDLVYGSWSDKTKAQIDAFTIVFLMIYLVVLLYGGFNSTFYAWDYGTRNPSAWRPYIWPVRLISCIGIFLMILQGTAVFFKDIAKIRGEEL